MNTKTAAAKAGRTIATIRIWCRRGVIAAVKTTHGWDIDEASLTRRITLSAPAQVEIGTGRCFAGAIGAHGPADTLAAAFANGTPVTITSGPLAGDRVYLKRTGYLAPTGPDRVYTDGTVLYRLDTDLTADAPRFENYLNEALYGAMDALRQADADERAYSNPRYM